uniref:TVP38/TMEM64 family protein n=1 Tax=Thaumasiovibrio occultus TaxID=1891184 RepID=UPI000B357CB4|nr:VTT domain-containing protein [Thaumasiovibrio occultus]
MAPLLKLAGVLVLFFLSTFVALTTLGWLSIEQLESWLTQAQSLHIAILIIGVIGLLFLDLFIAMPTLSIMILGGYFAGALIGGFAAFTGTLLAGIAGYGLSLRYGDKLVATIVNNAKERDRLKQEFGRYGVLMILLSRAAPILPEVTACLSGVSRMKLSTFLLAWSAVNLPYCFIAAYAGSISSVENPQPAIYTMIFLTAFFWLSWWLFKRIKATSPVNSL